MKATSIKQSLSRGSPGHVTSVKLTCITEAPGPFISLGEENDGHSNKGKTAVNKTSGLKP